MKAIYKSIFACLALVFGLTACNGDYELPPTGAPDGAEKLAVGIYEGEWAVTNQKTGEVKKYPGCSLTFELAEYKNPGDTVWYTEHNVNKIEIGETPKDLDLHLNSSSTVCNISRNSAGILNYWNAQGSNPIGTAFTGKIYLKTDTSESVVTLSYSVTVREGRGGKKITNYNYDFSGTKQPVQGN